MIEVHVSSKDLPTMVAILKKYPEMIDANIVDVFKMVLSDIERLAKHNAPVNTGRLRSDIGTKLNQREIEGIIYNTVEYSIFVHEGTRYKSARPYILNAIKGEEPKIKRELERNALKERRGLI